MTLQMMFRSFCMGKKDNDRELNEWYNEVNDLINLNLQIELMGYNIINKYRIRQGGMII